MRASFSCGAATELVPPWAEAVKAACSKRLMRLRVEPHDGGELMLVFAAAGGEESRPAKAGDEPKPGRIPGISEDSPDNPVAVFVAAAAPGLRIPYSVCIVMISSCASTLLFIVFPKNT